MPTSSEKALYAMAQRKLAQTAGYLEAQRGSPTKGRINKTILAGAVAFSNPEPVAARTSRYIPIDIYHRQSLRTGVRDLNKAIGEFFQALEFKFSTCDVIVEGSVQSISVVETPPMTGKEFADLQKQLAVILHVLNGREGKGDVKGEPLNSLEQQKIAAEIRKLEAESRKLGVDADNPVTVCTAPQK